MKPCARQQCRAEATPIGVVDNRLTKFLQVQQEPTVAGLASGPAPRK